MKTISTLVLACLLSHACSFSQTPNRFDVVIDELMVDPSPQVGLPNNEWIELKNISTTAFNLQGWRIADLTGSSGPFPSFILKPDSFVIVCTGSAVVPMSVFGTTISVTSFPSLDNAADQITLKNAQGKTMHCVSYSDKWYRNELKSAGGWSLEMIDTRNPCSGSNNWASSINPRGGSPGKVNSINATNPDIAGPNLLRAYATDSMNIVLVFDEPLDSMSAVIPANYAISEGLGQPLAALPVSPDFDRVNLRMATALLRDKVYTITVMQVTDCAGNPIGLSDPIKLGLAVSADSFNMVVNEILFNPGTAGVDYVEIVNRSNSIIDLKNSYIANRNNLGAMSSITRISEENRLFFPGEYMVVTTDAMVVKKNYITQQPLAFAEVGSMPSFNNDKGDVILLNESGKIIDELAYDASWHFKLIDNPAGVALERIDFNKPTQQSDNWHSASSSSGYGTPTYKNSQYRSDEDLPGDVVVSPEIVSPDNDGLDDFATINYHFPTPGYIANITVFDASGRTVRYLQRNALCGITGYYRWDGLGEKNRKLPVGIYIIYTEVFNLEGKHKQFKQAIVLARKH